MIVVKIPKKIRLEKLNFPQREMLRLGELGVEAVKARVEAGRNLQDAPSKPLSKSYARRKLRARRKPIRDLKFTGKMMGAFRVRRTAENFATAGLGGERNKGLFNQRIEEWLGFSEANRRRVLAEGQAILNRMKDRLVRVIKG